jgi:hypothetical protein
VEFHTDEERANREKKKRKKKMMMMMMMTFTFDSAHSFFKRVLTDGLFSSPDF